MRSTRPKPRPGVVGSGAAAVAFLAVGAREWTLHELRAFAPRAATVEELDSRVASSGNLASALLAIAVAAVAVALLAAWSVSREGPAPASLNALGWWVVASVAYTGVVTWRTHSAERPGGGYWVATHVAPPPHMVDDIVSGSPSLLPPLGLPGIALAAASTATYAWYVRRQSAAPRTPSR